MNRQEQKQYLDEVPQHIQDLIYQGQKIQAIKEVREASGLGLSDAKTRIEQITAEMQENFPQSFIKPEAKGCLSILVCVFALLCWLFSASST